MGHTIAEKAKLLRRVRILKKQLIAMESGFREGADPAEVLRIVASSRSQINGLMADVLEDHLRVHVLQTGRPVPEGASAAAEDLIDFIHAYTGR